MNPYLEKIASWVDLGDGVHQHPVLEDTYLVKDYDRPSVAEKQWSPYFSSQKAFGAKTFGVIGAGLGGLIGTSPVFGTGVRARAVNSLVGAAIGSGVGALSGMGLASAGNQQWRDNQRMVDQAVHEYVLRKHSAGYPKILRDSDDV